MPRLSFTILFALLFAVAIADRDTVTCSKVSCGSLSGSNCAAFSATSGEDDEDADSDVTGTWTLDDNCSSSEECSLSGSDIVLLNPTETEGTCQDIIATKLAGQTCSRDSECLSDDCSSDVCKGLDIGENCVPLNAGAADSTQGDLICDIGSYCSTDGLCSDSYVGKGEDCALSSECEGHYICNDGTCISYETIEKAQTCDSTLACEDGMYCEDNLCASSPDYDVTRGPWRTSCTEHWQCTPGVCDCSQPNEDGQPTCSLIDNYIEMLDYIRGKYDDVDTEDCVMDFKDNFMIPQDCTEKMLGYVLNFESDISFGDCYDDFEIKPEENHGTIMSLWAGFLALCIAFIH